MTSQLQVAIGAFVLSIGMAGPPLSALPIVYAAIIAAVISRSGKFVGAVAMGGTIVAGYLQHREFRLTLLIAAAILGAASHLFYRNARAAMIIAIAATVSGLAFLLVR